MRRPVMHDGPWHISAALVFIAFLLSLTGSAQAAVPSDIFSRSILFNDGAQSISIYLLMKTQWYDPATGQWADDDIVYKSAVPFVIPPQGTLNLSQYFNRRWNTNYASFGPGTYRVWAAATDGSSSVISRQDGSPVIATYNFVILASAVTCSDGKQNQGETGIDCGGPCPACVTTSGGGGGGGGRRSGSYIDIGGWLNGIKNSASAIFNRPYQTRTSYSQLSTKRSITSSYTNFRLSDWLEGLKRSASDFFRRLFFRR